MSSQDSRTQVFLTEKQKVRRNLLKKNVTIIDGSTPASGSLDYKRNEAGSMSTDVVDKKQKTAGVEKVENGKKFSLDHLGKVKVIPSAQRRGH